MLAPHLEPLLTGMSVYQDVLWDGRVLWPGERDCAARWALLEPHLPHAGTVLDVGSNFGWFALQTAAARPRSVIVSAEADPRSARVQRAVLESHLAQRIVLVTRRIGAAATNRLATRWQGIDAVFALNVLHWMRDHRAFLHDLGQIATRIFVEHPDPRESNAGLETVRREIGDIDSYLRVQLPQHDVVRLGETRGLPGGGYPRSIWLAVARDHHSSPPTPGFDIDMLLDLAPAWPPRSWWHAQLERSTAIDANTAWFTADGIQVPANYSPDAGSLRRLRRRIGRLPESELFAPRERWRRATRTIAGALRNRLVRLKPDLSSST